METGQNSKTGRGEYNYSSIKSNKVIETGNRIIEILAYLRGGVAGIYTQRKLDKLDKELEMQDWKEFVKEIKITFSDKTKADAK